MAGRHASTAALILDNVASHSFAEYRRVHATVIGGHQRLLAARRLGLPAVPVIWLDLSAEQARLLGLALNKISGSWDDALC